MRIIEKLDLNIKKGDKVVLFFVDGELSIGFLLVYDEVSDIDLIRHRITLKKNGNFRILEDLGGQLRLSVDSDDAFLYYDMDVFKKDIGGELDDEKEKYQRKKRLYNNILKQIENENKRRR